MEIVIPTLLSLTLLLGTVVAQSTAAPSKDGQAPKQAKALTPSFAFLQTPPKGMPAMPLPKDYAPTEAMFALGQRLFHDGILSKNQKVTCASCHLAANGFAHPDKRPPGVDGKRALRHGWGTSSAHVGLAPFSRSAGRPTYSALPMSRWESFG